MESKEVINALVKIEEECFSYDRITRGEFKKLFKNIIFSIDSKDNIVGYLSLKYYRNTIARIYSIAVLKKHRNKGIAKELINKAIDICKTKGYTEITLEVKEDNLKAIKLYNNLGFKEYSKKENYYEDGTTAVCLRKEFNGY